MNKAWDDSTAKTLRWRRLAAQTRPKLGQDAFIALNAEPENRIHDPRVAGLEGDVRAVERTDLGQALQQFALRGRDLEQKTFFFAREAFPSRAFYVLTVVQLPVKRNP